MSDITLPTGQRSILMTPVDINGTVISGAPPTILGTFRAINNGTGYSINDIIVLRQVDGNPPEYYNATTDAVITPNPNPADLGSVSSASNVSVVTALPAGTNTIGAISNTSFTANAGTNLNTSLLAVESGGNLASINTKLPASLGAKSSASSISVAQAFAATSTLANVPSSATSVSLLAANNNRKTAIIINDSTSDLYVTLNASAASTTNYSLFLAAKVGNTPSSLILKGDDYSDEIRGIWSSANGFARVTEIV